MKILLIGTGEAPHLGGIFRRSLEALGHRVAFADESSAFGPLDRFDVTGLLARVRRDLPTRFAAFQESVLRLAREFSPDLIFSVKGSYLSPDVLHTLKRSTDALLLNYSTDHPFNPAANTRYIAECVPLWDVYATPRAHTISELAQYCKGPVLYLPFGYDPDLHFPETNISPAERLAFGSDLVFIGTCDRDRMSILSFVADIDGIDVRFYGGGKRYKLQGKLRRRLNGFAVGRDYRLALNCSQMSLCLVRRANRDTHVMRTFEIPACGSFMLAERTGEHAEMFAEDREAVYFSDKEELRDKAIYYLKHEPARQRIARAGFERVVSGRNTYRDRLASLLDQIGSSVGLPKLAARS